jgi:hypothetical protein
MYHAPEGNRLPPLLLLVWFLLLGIAIGLSPSHQQRCIFDRNEIGPKGDYGQWYWEFYKCDDGTERRQMVAGPRG